MISTIAGLWSTTSDACGSAVDAVVPAMNTFVAEWERGMDERASARLMGRAQATNTKGSDYPGTCEQVAG